MRYGPGAARIPRLWELNNRLSGLAPGPTSTYWTLYMFNGPVPTAAQCDQYLNQNVAGSEQNINFYDLWTVMAAAGCTLLAGQPFVSQIRGEKFSNNAVRHKLTTADTSSTMFNSGQYACQVVAAGTPTWFALLGAATSILDPKIMNKSVAYKTLVQCTIGTVGDENSNADLQIKGGQILNDLTKLPIFGDLMIAIQ